MRISDWSSDVCSSDLATRPTTPSSKRGGTNGSSTRTRTRMGSIAPSVAGTLRRTASSPAPRNRDAGGEHRDQQRVRCRGRGVVAAADRKSVVWGKSVSVRVDLGGGRLLKKKNQ